MDQEKKKIFYIEDNTVFLNYQYSSMKNIYIEILNYFPCSFYIVQNGSQCKYYYFKGENGIVSRYHIERDTSVCDEEFYKNRSVVDELKKTHKKIDLIKDYKK